jgi:DnaA family protein
MTRQLPLALGLQGRMVLDDFVPGRNRPLLTAAAALLGGREQQLFVSGPQGSGRTHLLLGLCDTAKSQGLTVGYVPLGMAQKLPVSAIEGMDRLDLLALDDVDAVAGDSAWETALFALYNRARARGVRLICSAGCGPAVLPLRLADLRTRLAWGLSFRLEPLDDAGKLELLTREASRRGLTLPNEVARYLLARCPREVGRLLSLLEQLDRAALAAQRRLTIPFVRAQLDGVESY